MSAWGTRSVGSGAIIISSMTRFTPGMPPMASQRFHFPESLGKLPVNVTTPS